MANVAYDTSGSTTVAEATPSFSITIGNNSNRVLIVIAGYDAGGNAATAMTYNGASMTNIGGCADNNGSYQAFYLIAPATGAHTLSISGYSSNSSISVAYWSLYNADQTSAPDKESSSNGTSNPVTTSVTPSLSGGIVVGFSCNDFSIGLSTPANHTTSATGTSGAGISGGDSGVTANTNPISITSNSNGSAHSIGVLGVSITPFINRVTLTDTITGTDTVAGFRRAVVSLLDTITGTDTVSKIKTKVVSLLDTFTATDIISFFFKWTRQNKNNSTETNQTRNSSAWTDSSKDSSNFNNQNKN